jgi:hypothetical protein
MIVMRKLTLWCLLIILAGQASCQKNALKTSPLNGTWIESTTKNDTIVFAAEYDGQYPVFELKRGFRITEEGYNLPDYFSGPYSYNLSGDSISLYWFLSSGSFHLFFFEKMAGENKFLIGNFFKNPENTGTESDTLVFERIQ